MISCVNSFQLIARTNFLARDLLIFNITIFLLVVTPDFIPYCPPCCIGYILFNNGGLPDSFTCGEEVVEIVYKVN